jgi:isopropylmalate/homocitrate/citramalate synthase
LPGNFICLGNGTISGMPAVSPNDEAAICEIVKCNLDAEILCFCRCMVNGAELAADCGVDGIVIEIPSSQHLTETGYKWPLAKAVALSAEATVT